MNTYYEFMLNNQKYNINSIKYNNLIISKYKSSSYITNKMIDLKKESLLYNIGTSLVGGFFYGILSSILEEIIIKNVVKDS